MDTNPKVTFRTSPTTAAIDEAFAKAQRKFKTAVKNAANPHFKSRFADYEALIEAARDALNDEGIALLQPPSTTGTTAIVTTTLRHKGEWYAADVEMNAVQAGPQALGSCVSYAARYGLKAFLAIPSGDDDGEAAEGRESPPQPASRPQPRVETVKERVAAANGKPDPAKLVLAEAIVVLGDEKKAREFLRHERGDKAGTPISDEELATLRASLSTLKQQQKQINDAAAVLGAVN